MDAAYSQAIALLKKKLEEAEKRPAQLRQAINTMCEEAGEPLMYPNNAAPASGGAAESARVTPQNIGADTFFGKKQQTAVREYLEMRKAQNPQHGPATPREIFEALSSGGYQFEAKTDEIALVGIRSLLRKRYLVFQKLSNGKYGLTAWYPDMKPKKPVQKTSAETPDDEESADE